jgi:methyl-accepting chemotaxis protein
MVLFTILYTACVIVSSFLISMDEGLSFGQVLAKHISWMVVLLVMNVVLMGIYFSHKIAGPMYRFEWGLERIAEGDLTLEIRTRRGDAFKDFEAALNKTIKTLHQFVKEDQQIIQEIDGIVKELENQIKQNRDFPREKIPGLIEKLTQISQRTKLIITPFRIERGER